LVAFLFVERNATALMQRHPPREDREAIRGEACAVCPAHLNTCAGIEREW